MPVMLPGQGTGFTPVGDYLDANQGTIANEADWIGTGMGRRIDDARSAADALTTPGAGAPGYQDALDKAIAAKDQAAALGSEGGLSDVFQQQFHDTRQQGDFDAGLLGASGKLDIAGLQNRAGGLIDYLNGPRARVAPAALPARDTEPPAYQTPGMTPFPGPRRGPPQTSPYVQPRPRRAPGDLL